MAKIKKKKTGSTDMTAMCDVAFLLLTFFVMTSTAKIPEALPVDTPLQQFRLNYLNLI
jgi:biopolymer transport protein ExbD